MRRSLLFPLSLMGVVAVLACGGADTPLPDLPRAGEGESEVEGLSGWRRAAADADGADGALAPEPCVLKTSTLPPIQHPRSLRRPVAAPSNLGRGTELSLALAISWTGESATRSVAPSKVR